MFIPVVTDNGLEFRDFNNSYSCMYGPVFNAQVLCSNSR